MSDPKREQYRQFTARERSRYRGMPSAGDSLISIRSTVEALRENMEVLLRQRGEYRDSAARVDDLARIYEILDDLEARVSVLEGP